MYVSLFSYVWIPESPHIWERADDSVCHMPHLFTYVTSWCDFFPLVWYIVGGVSDLIVSVPGAEVIKLFSCSAQLSMKF